MCVKKSKIQIKQDGQCHEKIHNYNSWNLVRLTALLFQVMYTMENSSRTGTSYENRISNVVFFCRFVLVCGQKK